MHQLRRTRLLVAVPTALLLSVAAVGCGLAEDAAKDRAEEALASEGISADLDDPSNIEIEGTDGGVSTGKLPKDFPTDEVPVVDGEILAGTFTKNPQTWNATIKVGEAGGDKSAAYDEAEAKLVDAGLETVTPKADNGSSIGGQYTSASWTVVLAVTDTNGIVVNYTVSPK
ncbi:hypothetical protein D0Z08_11295 [Nocardioides immobilis]|uniref:Uncharacterized protein n=1 Tax=Nocardioides immobilis TaxID=2049295 RepID=A0A417Y3J6_9ACTN|nr:hypothetical protein [Nocardioides immobilis]RHW27232.1 hypothetical protein D0Z08_11295 [Nocardioides immobilis]